MFSTGVLTGVGWTVLMEPKARPNRPSEEASCVNCDDNLLASSMAWFSTVMLPISILSVPTVPDADDESPYWICQEEPELFLNVLDFVGS